MHSTTRTLLPARLTFLHRVSSFYFLFLFFLLSLLPTVYTQTNDQKLDRVHSSDNVQFDIQTKSYSPTGQYFEDTGSIYVAEFIGADRGLLGRALTGTTSLANNAPANLDISPGVTNYYEFPLSNLKQRRLTDTAILCPEAPEQKKVIAANATTFSNSQGLELESSGTKLSTRKDGANNITTLYVSMNVCQQPSFTNKKDINDPPQLSLYISTMDQNPQPGPSSSGPQNVLTLEQGFISIRVNTTSNVYISVHAPNVTITPNILWNYDLAASTDAPYHAFNDSQPFLYLVDSDQTDALLVTQALSEARLPQKGYQGWVEAGPPFSIFVKQSNDTSLNGMLHSYCGLKLKSQIQASNIAGGPNSIRMGITTRGITKTPKQEIYVPYLNGTSTYDGFLAIDGNSTASGGGVVRGGGTVFQGMNFTTKQDGNCAVIFNLTFCDQVAYAAPSNPYRYTTEALSALYDSDAVNLYQNFSYSLQQIPCNTSSTAQYSLVRNCDDCAAAYKTWLCAVTIPRCADYTSPPADDSYLVPRNVAQAPFGGSNVPVVTNQTLLNSILNNSTRNNYTIAGLIQPGPYKEVLPCSSLCYDLVQSCPAALGFGCPYPGRGLEASYGESGNAPNGAVSCSAPGEVYYPNEGGRPTAEVGIWSLWTLVLAYILTVTVF